MHHVQPAYAGKAAFHLKPGLLQLTLPAVLAVARHVLERVPAHRHQQRHQRYLALGMPEQLRHKPRKVILTRQARQIHVFRQSLAQARICRVAAGRTAVPHQHQRPTILTLHFAEVPGQRVQINVVGKQRRDYMQVLRRCLNRLKLAARRHQQRRSRYAVCAVRTRLCDCARRIGHFLPLLCQPCAHQRRGERAAQFPARHCGLQCAFYAAYVRRQRFIRRAV